MSSISADEARNVATSTPATGGRRDSTTARVVVAAALAAVALAVLLPAQARSRAWSPFDEATHIGYAWSVTQGHIPARGDSLPQPVLDSWACAGQPNVELPACGAAAAPTEFPGRGENYNFGHPPLYYLITGVIARGVTALFPGHSFVTVARLASIAWIWAGMVLLFVALRRWSVPLGVATATSVVVVTLPWTLHSGMTVTNDAPAILCGAAAIWLLHRIVAEGRSSPWIPAVITAAAASTKVLNALPFLAAAVVLVVLAFARRRDAARRRLVTCAIAMVGAVAVVYLAWSAFQSERGVANWVSPIEGANDRPIVGSPVSEWLSAALGGFDLVNTSYVNADIAGPTLSAWTYLVEILAVAGPWVALIVFRWRDKRQALVLTTLISLASYPMLAEAQVFVATGGAAYFPTVTTRYGVSATPLALACCAMVLSSRRRASNAYLTLCATGVLLTAMATAGLP